MNRIWKMLHQNASRLNVLLECFYEVGRCAARAKHLVAYEYKYLQPRHHPLDLF